MSVVLFRIDDRLVHGQVMTAWSKIYRTNRIFVVDNNTANDRFLCDVMKMSVPGEYTVTILNNADAAERISSDPADVKTMVLMKTPATAKALIDAGIVMPQLNVGNIDAEAGRLSAVK